MGPYRKSARGYIERHITDKMKSGPGPKFDDLSAANQEKVLDLWHAGMPIWEWFEWVDFS